VPAALGLLTMPEPLVTRSGLRLRPHRWRFPPELRATFAEAAVAAFAGAAVLGLFTAVSPAFLGQTLGVTNRAAVGLVVFVVFAASTLGQASLQVVRERIALAAGCMVLIAGMGFVVLGLSLSSLTLLVLGGAVAGFGQGLSFRAGLAAVNARSPAERRAEAASRFFVVMYVALALPVIGVGVLAQVAGLRAAGLTFAAVVSALAAVVLLLLWRVSQHEERVERPERLAA
jgi:MFS family permease